MIPQAKSEWWLDPAEVSRTGDLLTRAGVLPETERDYYATKPWKWDAERSTCLLLEHVMELWGVDPRIGWEMELGDIVRLGQARDAVRHMLAVR
jgi:hypothetical protein